jgi:hypothetical protein
MIMRSAAAICSALAFGILAFPVAAQQTGPDQPLPPAHQSAPEMPPAPPPEPQSPPEVPPPFPPMPPAPPTHRWVNIGHDRATHAHHRTKHSTTRTMRWCRSMSHRQMMRHSTCRMLMRHHHHMTKHRHHGVRHHHQVAHRHRTVHRHGRRHRHAVRHHAS